MSERVSTASAPALLLEKHQKSKILEFALDCVEKSQSLNDQFSSIWNENLDNYLVRPVSDSTYPKLGMRSPRGASQGALRGRRTQDGQSVMKAPTIHDIIENMAGQGIGLLMPTLDFIEAVPIGKDDPEKARTVQRHLQSVLRMQGIYRTNQMTFKDAFIIGTGIIEIGWETRTRMQMTEVPVIDEETGFVIGSNYEPREVTFRDLPLFQQIDRFDFYPDPSGTRIQENMGYCGKRFRIPQSAAMGLARAGVWWKDAVEAAIKHEGEPSETRRAGSVHRFMELRKEAPSAFGTQNGVEIWANLPWRPPDGVRNKVITVLNGELVRSRMNPHADGNFPMKEIVLNPVAGRFDGISPAETMRFLQDSLDNLLMVFNDMADISARNILLAGLGAGIDPLRLRKRIPGDVIPCNNPDMIKPVPYDVNAMAVAASEIVRREAQMYKSSGATDPQMIADVDRASATQINQVVRLSSQRVQLMTQLTERDDWPWVGRTLLSRLRQYLDRGRQAIVAGEILPIPLNEIDMQADIRFVGSRFAESQFQTNAKYREVVNVIGTNPQALLLIPDIITRWFRDGLEIMDAEQIVDEAQQRFLALQQAQAAQAQENSLQGSPVSQANSIAEVESAAAGRQGVPLA